MNKREKMYIEQITKLVAEIGVVLDLLCLYSEAHDDACDCIRSCLFKLVWDKANKK